MKKQLLLSFALLIMLILTGCSEKDDNPTDVQVWGYKLGQFINQLAVNDSVDATLADSIDIRNLFNYEIVSGEDGFSPRQSANAGYDLGWSIFKEGYFVPSNGNRTWFADTFDLPGAFKVSDTGYYRLYRKIDVDTGAKGVKDVELRGLSIYPITNWDNETEDAIKLSDLLTGIAAYDSISIICFDGYGEGKYYLPEAVNDGYYLLNTERTIFPTATLPNNMKRMKKVEKIVVYGATSVQNHDFELAPQDAADMIFMMPVNLDGFEREDLNGIISKNR